MRKHIVATCPYFGTNGFVNHARNFFGSLSKYNNIYIKDLNYNNNYDYTLPVIGHRGVDANYSTIHSDEIFDIVLAEAHEEEFKLPEHAMHHHKIGYYVWESTSYYPDALDKMQYLDQIWVPSKWHKILLTSELDNFFGITDISSKIRIVPEGINPDLFNINDYNINTGKFKFIIIGSWEFRKYTKEMVNAFIELYGDNNDVELYLVADNQWVAPYLCSEYLKQNFDYIPNNIIPISYINNQNNFIKLMKSSNCLLSVSRAEGWSLPLNEMMACGIPVITLDWSGPTEYISDYANTVMIDHYVKVPKWKDLIIPGYYAEPDYNDLKDKMEDVFNNYSDALSLAIAGAKHIADNFTWDNAAKIADHHLNELANNRGISSAHSFILSLNNAGKQLNNTEKKLEVKVSYIDGVNVSISGGDENKIYNIKFIDSSTSEILYETDIKTNNFCEPYYKYFIDWTIIVSDIESGNIIHSEKLDLKNKDVLICLNSDALGDNIAWFPYADEFRKLHNIKTMYVYTSQKNLFIDSEYYRNIIFVDREDVYPVSTQCGIYAKYVIGCDDNDYFKNKNNWRTIPLQQVATDTLGMDYYECKPVLNGNKYYIDSMPHNYVTISPDSTMQPKLWNTNVGWQEVCNYINHIEYDVHYVGNCVTGTQLDNVKTNHQMNLEEIKFQIVNGLFHIGLGSGLSWLAWAYGKKVILISGFSKPFSEFECYRVFNDTVCNGCYNDISVDFTRDWYWCPHNKNYECTRNITSEMVVEQISKLIVDGI